MPAWGGYKNGHIPKSALVRIYGNQYASPATATAYKRIAAQFEPHFHTPLVVDSAYRTEAEQADLSAHPEKAWGPVAPAGHSEHGWADALDFGNHISDENSAEHQWMRVFAPSVGLENTGEKFHPAEPGHWECHAPNQASGEPVTGTTPSEGAKQGLPGLVNNTIGGAVSVMDMLGTILTKLTDKSFWQRTGLFLLGGLLLIIVVTKLTESSQVVSDIKDVATSLPIK